MAPALGVIVGFVVLALGSLELRWIVAIHATSLCKRDTARRRPRDRSATANSRSIQEDFVSLAWSLA